MFKSRLKDELVFIEAKHDFKAIQRFVDELRKRIDENAHPKEIYAMVDLIKEKSTEGKEKIELHLGEWF